MGFLVERREEEQQEQIEEIQVDRSIISGLLAFAHVDSKLPFV
jgi:hypothetical protein